MTQLRPRFEARLQSLPRTTTPPPTLESFADDLYDALLPVAWLDAQADWHLAYYCGAAGEMFQDVADVARDTPAGPGWSAVMDLGRCPDAWLPWLGQFAGVTVIPGSTPAEMRERIARTDGFRRGTPEAIRAAAQATLTGNRTVYFRERNGGAYRLDVVTLSGETPDPAATRAALMAQKPGGILLTYNTVTGQDWQALRDTPPRTWTKVKADYATWQGVRDNAMGS